MKASELKQRIEAMRGGYEETERNLLECRIRTNASITVAEVEARAGYQVCNYVLGVIDTLVYEQEVIS